MLKSEFEKLKLVEDETVDQFVGKITGMVSKATGLGHVFEQYVLVKTLLDVVPDKYFQLVASIKQTVDLDNMRFKDAVGRLKAFEYRLRGRERASESQSQLLFNRSEVVTKANRMISPVTEVEMGRVHGNVEEAGKPEDKDCTKPTDRKLEAEKVEESTWYLDNGASNHMTGDDRVLSDVYFVPSLKDNIISLSQAMESRCNAHMKEDYLLLYDDGGKLMMKAFRTRNQPYTIKLTVGVLGYVKKFTPIQKKLNDSGTQDDQGKLLFALLDDNNRNQRSSYASSCDRGMVGDMVIKEVELGRAERTKSWIKRSSKK
ncbi:uncharacterized protein LOC143613662 [Bidens hawaiensis]|uniref:uncharacterized protein LOC143613662 n=1 Tax=Bidens hawaiensis TaxID=980011 RepID=UPI004049BB3E